MSEHPVAIVTGGAQGLGAAISVALLKEGYKVCLTDVQCQKGRDFVQEQEKTFGKDNILFFCCDVSKEADIRGTFEYTVKEFGRIDVLVNNAGIICEKDIQKVFSVNVTGTIIGCQVALEYMGKSRGGKGGFVINVASICGLLPHPSIPVYVATKHAVIGLTRSYGDPFHLVKEGVLFAALCPTFVGTEMLNDLEDNSLVKGVKVADRYDVQTPEEVAQGAIKLLQDGINGSTLTSSQQHGLMYAGLSEELKVIQEVFKPKI